MSPYCKQYAITFYLMVLCYAIVPAATLAFEGNAKNPIVDDYQYVIVLDPGHGGDDQGAKGPDGTLEKDVTLNLARMLAVELGNKHKVILTRTDDYRLDVPDRTAVANHEDADLFISLHAGGSFFHQASGMTLYYFKEPTGSALTLDPEYSKPLKPSTQIPWNKIQNRHKTTSSVLAELIRKRLSEQMIFIESKVQGAPLMVLEGADMPAIVIEIGYITNPAEEKALRDIETLAKIAKGIGNAIEDFFQKVR
uniref:N-acetylmuramoyl-L-alanine amidase n=1 Tax=Candidatus Desulfatibia profunda TaxID=2841695 RepID=A0A8J6NKQ7_9BACT|nr:N-acetylmuramoyl-L-alanine amidase [Candidatus Desulfatibia profunda]